MKKKILHIYKGNYFKFLKKFFFFKFLKFIYYTFQRSFFVNIYTYNKFFFIHKGYLFVHRFICSTQLNKKLGELAITRKPLVKAIKKNK